MIKANLICVVCTNGDLDFMTRSEDGRVYLECAECMTGYWNAADLTASEKFRAEAVDWEARPATVEEVARAGWADLHD